MVSPFIVGYLTLGAVAGLFAGLFGIGGGVVLVPALIWLFTAQMMAGESLMVMAVATSLATIFFTSIASVMAHHRLGALKWPLVFSLTPGIVFGSIGGAVVADRLPGEMLQLVFALFLLLVALRMGLAVKPKVAAGTLTTGLMLTAGGLIGGLSAILGIGGGSMTVPFLSRFNLPMRHAVAVSSACGIPISLAGSVSYIMLGREGGSLPEWSLGYIYLPAFFGIITTSILFAPLGAKLAHGLPTAQLKRGFALLLIVVAVKMVANPLLNS